MLNKSNIMVKHHWFLSAYCYMSFLSSSYWVLSLNFFFFQTISLCSILSVEYWSIYKRNYYVSLCIFCIVPVNILKCNQYYIMQQGSSIYFGWNILLKHLGLISIKFMFMNYAVNWFKFSLLPLTRRVSSTKQQLNPMKIYSSCSFGYPLEE